MSIYKITYTKFIQFLFFITPIFDMLNGYFYRKYSIKGIGSTFHFIFLVTLISIWVLNKRINITMFEKILFYFVISAIIGVGISSLMGIQITSVAVEREIKIITTLLICTILISFVKERFLDYNIIEKILDKQSQIIIYVSTIVNLTGLYNYSYEYSNQGKIGLYTNLNEYSIIISSLVIYNIIKNSHNISIKRVIIIIAGILCLVLTESKFAIIMCIIIIFALLCIFIKSLFKKITKNHIVVMGCLTLLISVGYVIFDDRIKQSINSLLLRQNYLSSIYSQQSFLGYLSSGRTLRIKYLIFDLLNEKLDSLNIIDNLKGVIYFLFGNGLSSAYGDTLEMDMLDIFLLNGFIGFALYIIFNIFVIKRSQINKSNFYYFTLFFVITVASMFVGHVWTGGVCSLYYGLIVAYTISIKNKKEVLYEKI